MANRELIEYQQERIRHIRSWHHRIGDPENHHNLDTGIQFLLVWTTFNALYNVVDMPNRKPLKPRKANNKPKISWTRETTKMKNIVDVVGRNPDFIRSLYRENRAFCDELSSRRPRVSQPQEIDAIHYEVEGESYTFHPNEAQGIASLDNRVILEDGSKLFEYSSLNIAKDERGRLTDPRDFLWRLILILYQIRNNIAHGGSAAFFARGNKVSRDSVQVLHRIVNYLLHNHDMLIGEHNQRAKGN